MKYTFIGCFCKGGPEREIKNHRLQEVAVKDRTDTVRGGYTGAGIDGLGWAGKSTFDVGGHKGERYSGPFAS
jgi:hypothetical protein